MGNVNIPSYNALLPKERRIRSIQELYEAVKELQTGGSSELSARVEALESLISEGDNPTLIIDKFNEILDFLDGYDNTDSLVDLLSGKQDALVSGTNIKTINNESILGAGNITIQGGGGSQVQSDWNQSDNTAVDYIKNKPTDVSAFNNDAGYLTQHQDISGKEDVTTIVAPINATDATLPITSLTCETGKYYRVDVPVETLAVTLPAMAANVTSVKTITIYLTGGTTPAVTISTADSKDVYYQDGYEIEAGKTYEINALFNGSTWVVAAVEIIVPGAEVEEGGE